jgi:hypothetical protein
MHFQTTQEDDFLKYEEKNLENYFFLFSLFHKNFSGNLLKKNQFCLHAPPKKNQNITFFLLDSSKTLREMFFNFLFFKNQTNFKLMLGGTKLLVRLPHQKL